MKNKKLIISIISVVFAVVVICLAVSVFTVKQVDVKFTFSANNVETTEINSSMDGFVGKNLLFLDTKDISNELEKNPYIEVLNVEKKFPNIVEVSVKERREIYSVTFSGKTYITDMNGLVLCEKNPEKTYGEHELINLELKNITVEELTVGKVIKTNADSFLSTAFEISKSVDLTDSVKTLKVEKRFSGTDNLYLSFETYSGVNIVINKAEEKGQEKALMGFSVYDTETDDYVKSFNTIEVNMLVGGSIRATWTTLIGD